MENMFKVLISVILGASFAFISFHLGHKNCERLAVNVGLNYSYGLNGTGSSCAVYYDNRWVSLITYYEFNNIDLPR